MYRLFLILHILAATVWVGGHLVLCLSVLPRAMRRRDPAIIREFEDSFERVGLPALLIQVITGIHLAAHWVPDVASWFAPSSGLAWLVFLKFAFLLGTVGLAAHARLRIIPRLDASRLPVLAAHIITVTVLGVGFVILGVGIRTGGFF